MDIRAIQKSREQLIDQIKEGDDPFLSRAICNHEEAYFQKHYNCSFDEFLIFVYSRRIRANKMRDTYIPTKDTIAILHHQMIEEPDLVFIKKINPVRFWFKTESFSLACCLKLRDEVQLFRFKEKFWGVVCRACSEPILFLEDYSCLVDTIEIKI